MDIIKRLAESDPTYEGGMGDIHCVFCGPLDYGEDGPTIHSPDCLWLYAQQSQEKEVDVTKADKEQNMNNPREWAEKHQRQELIKVLQLAWPDLSDNAEIVLVDRNPWMTPDGLIHLQVFRFTAPIKMNSQSVLKPPVSVPYFEFTGQRRQVQNNDYVYLLTTQLDDIEGYLFLRQDEQEDS